MSSRKAVINNVSYTEVDNIMKSLRGSKFCALSGDKLTVFFDDCQENYDFLENYQWMAEEDRDVNFPIRINSFDQLATYIKVMWEYSREGRDNPEYTEDWMRVMERYVEECKLGPSINGTLIRMISGAYYSGDLENAILDVRAKFKRNWEDIKQLDTLTNVTDYLFRKTI